MAPSNVLGREKMSWITEGWSNHRITSQRKVAAKKKNYSFRICYKLLCGEPPPRLHSNLIYSKYIRKLWIIHIFLYFEIDFIHGAQIKKMNFYLKTVCNVSLWRLKLLSFFFCLHVTFWYSSSAVKSKANHPWISSPFTLYVLALLGKASAISVEFSNVNPVLQKPKPSLDNCRSQYRTTSCKLLDIANWYENWLESGNKPENPPRAMTRGRWPVGHHHKD